MKTGSTTAAQRFQDGLQQLDQKEFGRALTIFAECVCAEPANVEFVETLLAHLHHARNSPGAAKITPAEASARSNALACEGWATVLQLGPRLLAEQPDDLQTVQSLAAAARSAGYPQVEIRYLQAALAMAPQDINNLRRAGHAFTGLQRLEDALACWRQVETQEPGDVEAARMISSLTIAKSRERVGLRGSGAADNAMNHRTPELAPAFVRAGGVPARIWQRTPWEQDGEKSPDFQRTPIQELESAIRDLPADPAAYLQLANLYLERGRDYDAERLLVKGREATGGDLDVLRMWEEVVIQRLEKKVMGARELAETDESPQSRAALEAARNERDRLETEIFVGRCLREPQNAAARYQLGVLLKRAGKLREACESFQAALLDPVQRSPAAQAMGECYEELHQIPEALQHYRQAADAALLPEQLEGKKQALYDAGRLVVGLDLPRLAQRYLGELVELAPDHEEAQRLLSHVQNRESRPTFTP